MKKKGLFKGVATVEAAFIMPIVIGVVMILLEYSLMLHDEAALTGIASEEVIRCAEYLQGKSADKYDFAALSRSRLFFRDSNTALNRTKNEIRERLGTALLFSEIQGIEVKKQGTDVLVRITIQYRRAAPFLKSPGKTAELRRSLFDRENKTRLASVIVDTVSAVKDAIFGGDGADAEQKGD